jgi:hypothetical protein
MNETQCLLYEEISLWHIESELGQVFRTLNIVFLCRKVILGSYFSTWLGEQKYMGTVIICMLKEFLEK